MLALMFHVDDHEKMLLPLRSFFKDETLENAQKLFIDLRTRHQYGSSNELRENGNVYNVDENGKKTLAARIYYNGRVEQVQS